MRKLIIELNSLEITDTVARKMAAHLFPGAILLLWGSMGAGKTTFAKSLCARLGVNAEIVTSPTYTLVNMYPAHWSIFHVDLYRLAAPEQLDDFDHEDLFAGEGITLVEWPEYILNYLTDEPVLNLLFEIVSENKRRLFLESRFCEFDILFNTLEQPIATQEKTTNSLIQDSA